MSATSHPFTCSRRRLFSALAAPALALAVPGFVQAASDVEDRYQETGALHGIINNVREANGLAALARSARLDDAARFHSSDMAWNGFLGHTSSDGTDAISRIRRFYTLPTWVGETLGGGYASAGDLVGAWLASDGHRAVLLGSQFQTLGISCMRRPDTPHQWYWTANFGGEVDS